MSNEQTDGAIGRASTTEGTDQPTPTIDNIERVILDRRPFLKGVVAGGLSIGGIGAGLSQLSDSGFQKRASLAGGELATAAPTRYYLPGVDANLRGIIAEVTVEFTDLDAGLFVNLNDVEVRHDLQLALRESIATAQRLTGTSLASTGVLVTFSSQNGDYVAFRGKSWEAGITIALVAALTGRTLSRRTLVTGVVTDEGAFLQVGSITAKARAARAFGASRLLVPNGQAREIDGISVEGTPTIGEASRAIVGNL